MTHATDLLVANRDAAVKSLADLRERRQEYQEALDSIDDQIREGEAMVASYNGALVHLGENP